MLLRFLLWKIVKYCTSDTKLCSQTKKNVHLVCHRGSWKCTWKSGYVNVRLFFIGCWTTNKNHRNIFSILVFKLKTMWTSNEQMFFNIHFLDKIEKNICACNIGAPKCLLIRVCWDSVERRNFADGINKITSLRKHVSKKFLFCKRSNMIEPCQEKTCFCHMWTTKAQISLRIHAVWSAPLLFTA